MSSVMGKYYPFEIKDLEPVMAKKLKKMIPETDAIVVGPKPYVFAGNHYKDVLPKIYTMSLKTDDIFGLGLPRSGTTWSQELIWLLANDLDFEKAKSTPFSKRFLYLERSGLSADVLEKLDDALDLDQLLTSSSRRLLKSHMPFSLLPPSLLDTTKVVYMARDPRDVAVSICHISKFFNNCGDLKTIWRLFIQNLIPNLQYFEHVKEAWELRHHPNMLFIFYEDMSKDLRATICKVATFLNKQLTDDQVDRLEQHLKFENMKAHVDLTSNAHRTVGENHFIRKGKVGAWREEFDDEMFAEADAWIADNLRDTDYRWPQQ